MSYATDFARVIQYIKDYAGKIQFCLERGWVDASVDGYSILVQLMVALNQVEMVLLVNELTVTDRRSSLIVKAWCQHHELVSPVIEFETAACWGESIGEIFSYRGNKKTWGTLVSVRSLFPGERESALAGADNRRNGDASYRMSFSLKEENPIRLKQTTRNELKLWLGPKAVAEAMRNKKSDFIASLPSSEAKRLQRVTGLAPGELWSAIRNGDQDLVLRLGEIPSARREQMAKRGMYVANHVDPQGAFF